MPNPLLRRILMRMLRLLTCGRERCQEPELLTSRTDLRSVSASFPMPFRHPHLREESSDQQCDAKPPVASACASARGSACLSGGYLKVIMSAVVIALMASCSTSSTDLVHLPDGQTGFAINCSGAGSGSSWAECYQRAGTACGASGYDIVSKDNDDGATAGGGVSNLATANVKSRSMVIRCK